MLRPAPALRSGVGGTGCEASGFQCIAPSPPPVGLRRLGLRRRRPGPGPPARAPTREEVERPRPDARRAAGPGSASKAESSGRPARSRARRSATSASRPRSVTFGGLKEIPADGPALRLRALSRPRAAGLGHLRDPRPRRHPPSRRRLCRRGRDTRAAHRRRRPPPRGADGEAGRDPGARRRRPLRADHRPLSREADRPGGVQPLPRRSAICCSPATCPASTSGWR